ncbi:MAG: threonine synthase [Bacteroidota bacterium]
MTKSFFTHIRCSKCNQEYSNKEIHTICPKCGRVLIAEYDLVRAKKMLSPTELAHRPHTLWRYRELLPILDDANIVSLGEGWTPIYETPFLANELGIKHLFIKEEANNPTGSFKARGLCLAVSKAKELGITAASMPSAGNAGGALAAYAAKAKMQAHIFVPRDTPAANIAECSIYGASVTLVDGVISDAGKKMQEMRSGTNWFDMSTMKEPYRLEGKKTMGYELAEQFKWEVPDVIIYPTGGGTGLIGMWKAFREMEEMGWILSKKPKMVSVQAAGCAPIVKAFNEKKSISEFWNNAQTTASGLRVPKAFADDLILDILYESHGTAIAVSDEEILHSMKRVGNIEGLLLCPEGAATAAGAEKLKKSGFLSHNDSVLLFNTGSPYKYIEVLKILQKS